MANFPCTTCGATEVDDPARHDEGLPKCGSCGNNLPPEAVAAPQPNVDAGGATVNGEAAVHAHLVVGEQP